MSVTASGNPPLRLRPAVALLLALVTLPSQAQSPPVSAAAGSDARREIARDLAGSDLTAPYDFFCVPGNARPNDFSAPPLKPVRLFDNLYAAGNSETVVYAITTSAGIVLIDAGMAAEVESVLVPGLVALGLDPADVELVLLGHGHSDHYGGASYFQSRYGARVATTEADWATIGRAATSGRAGDLPVPARDLVVRDGEPVELGDLRIVPVEIPGHTPGALGFVFPVFDGQSRHTAGLFGGTVLAAAYTPPAGLLQYVDSLGRWLDITAELGVDVEIQNHPIFDDMSARLDALARRQPGDPHAFVIGRDGFQRFWRIVSECMQAELNDTADR